MASPEAFLQRVRHAAQQGCHYRPHTAVVPEGTGYLGARGDLVQRLVTEVKAVGGEAFVVDGLAAAGKQLKALVAEASAKAALCWRHELLDRLGLKELLSESNAALQDYNSLAALPEAERKKTILACDVGITSCDRAIAETGSLMMCAGAGHERVASLTPPMHIAVIERKQIVPDLIDAFAWLSDSGLDQLPSNVTLITGPSKTGDIELQLTTGVHGPGKWRVIVIDGE